MRKSSIVYAAGVLILSLEEPAMFLLMKHKNRWDLPKGHADPGEKAVETAIREMQEETGISPDQVDLDLKFRFRTSYPVTYRKHPGKEFEKRLTIFLGRIPQATHISCTEHRDSKWFPWNPPHKIQSQTIDPLLRLVELHLETEDAPGRQL